MLRADDVPALLDFADRVLPTLRLRNGLYCFDRQYGEPELRGESVRYSIMVLLGMTRRAESGATTTVDLDELHRRIHDRRSELGVGDLGLLLWADVRLQSPRAAYTLADLERRSADADGLDRLEGMEAAWFVLGAAEALAAGLDARGVADRAIGHLRMRQAARSPLFRHLAARRPRAVLPNFATQIYSLLALAELARHGLDSRAEADAKRLADLLVELRGDDAGWPWLFHAEKATVIERYEIYSVHQDAMAPMGFFALAEVCGDPAYAQVAAEGVAWCYGANEIGAEFYDPEVLFAHRSVRRRGAAGRAVLAANTAVGSVLGSAPRVDVGPVELNSTCRPYHLGWILEAWSTRPELHDLVRTDRG